MSISYGFPQILNVQDAPITDNTKFGTLKVLLTATILNCDGTNLVGRRNIYIQNNSLSGIYIGDVDVSKEKGVYLASGNTLSIPIDPNINVDIYGISVGTPAFISIIEV